MRGGLPIDIGDLVHARSVEDNRREFKASWNDVTAPAVVKTVCAFANDLLNLNGGYVVLGIDTDDKGRPVLPPRGLDDADVDLIQREVRGQCNRIDPDYRPLLFPELYDDRAVLVIWAPAGDTRPYQAPESRTSGERRYYVRQGSETVEATGPLRSQLMEQAAKVPFDDRRSLDTGADRISERLVREFLADVGSEISRGAAFDVDTVYANMRLVVQLNAHLAPRNVALMFFTDDPDEVFPGARIEIVQFADDGDLIEERTIRGPLNHQVNQALTYLDSLGSTLFEKVPGRAEVDKTVTYPYEAIEEAIVNAVYHRSYESGEPIKVYMYPDRMEIISYPGPVQGIEMEQLAPGSTVPPRTGPEPPDRRVAEGASPGGGQGHGTAQDTPAYERKRVSRAALRVRPGAHVLPRSASRAPSIHGASRAAGERPGMGDRRPAKSAGRPAANRPRPAGLGRRRRADYRIRRVDGRPRTCEEDDRPFRRGRRQDGGVATFPPLRRGDAEPGAQRGSQEVAGPHP